MASFPADAVIASNMLAPSRQPCNEVSRLPCERATLTEAVVRPGGAIQTAWPTNRASEGIHGTF